MNDSKNGSGQNSEPKDPPKIEFPCEDYPVKVMGDSGSEFYDFAVEVMQRHAAGLDLSRIAVKGSRNGRFQSITFMITATGVDQLQALHQELSASPMTKMVL
ncbi:MAG: YbeD family protein [Cellvibrionaceae bacterium]